MTPELRNQAHRLGALMKCASMGLTAKEASAIEPINELVNTKVAEGLVESTLDSGIKGVALLSALAGIPMGAMWHLIDRSADTTNYKVDNLKAQAGIYRNAATDFEQSLAKKLKGSASVRNYEDDMRNPYRLGVNA